MPEYELFSKRQKRLEQADRPTIYQYDSLPKPFRVQVTYIWDRAIGRYDSDYLRSTSSGPVSNKVWDFLHDVLAEEKGLHTLGDTRHHKKARYQDYFLTAEDMAALDAIELSFRAIDRMLRDLSDYDERKAAIVEGPGEAIARLNRRFNEHAIGYQYAGGQIIRVDSTYMHSEAVEPALALLHAAGFRGPSDEFLRAHEHYRHGRHKEAIAEALKAFESTMKAICEARNWPYTKGAAAKELINVLFANGLLPESLRNHFSALRQVLEAGLPTVRNKMGGHGQGSETIAVPPYFAQYALNLAASNILLLTEAHAAEQ